MRRTNLKAKRSNQDRTWNSLNREVFCLRVVDNNSRSRLFRFQLKFLAELHVDAVRLQQRKELLLIFEIGTGGITEAVARALVFLTKQSRQLRRIRAANPQLLTKALVPHLGKCLRALTTKAVKVEIVRVIICVE